MCAEFRSIPDSNLSVNKPSGVSPASQNSLVFEPFVDADAVATFLSLDRRQVLDWARSGEIPAHPLGRGKRRSWRFRLSEITETVLSHKKPNQSTILSGSPQTARKRGGNANG